MAPVSRRQLLKSTLAAATVTVVPSRFGRSVARSYAANERLNIACIGVGGRGGAHIQPSLNQNLVAICDVSEGALSGCLRSIERFNAEKKEERPLPRRFYDYRALIAAMEKEIDAVVIATPDHHHAPAAMLAMQAGKHVYCEKPLTHDIWEARQLAQVARERRLATQMGNQGRAGEGWRLLAEYIWAGVVGDVVEVHAWTDRPGIPKRFWWPQGGTRPAYTDPVPASLDWELWLGPAPKRPYVAKYLDGPHKGRNVYCPFVWRGWWDFGTGALGDIGCHALSGIFTALKIEHAAAVELVKDSGDGTDEQFPCSSVIRWEIPAREGMPPCKLYWYDGGEYPAREVGELAEGKEYPDNGLIVVGTKGKLADYGRPLPIPAERLDDFTPPPKSIPRCESNHFDEWVTACKGGRAPFSNFDHAGPLTEFVLLGNLALKAGRGVRVEWNGKLMSVTNVPSLNEWVRRPRRRGWEV
ncbi:MAG: Gfo/Idh/MocA family oxidoreductase [Armatimonadota bacterium]|nr:Gfo/Idh/MocA family oxidoreductase [Armatimonadota bacterium]